MYTHTLFVWLILYNFKSVIVYWFGFTCIPQNMDTDDDEDNQSCYERKLRNKKWNWKIRITNCKNKASIRNIMTIISVLTCYGIILLTALCLGNRQYGARKIRHDHKGQMEGTQPDIDFEFESTKGSQSEYGEDYDDQSDDVTLDIVHGLFDTRKGIVPNIIYQGIYTILFSLFMFSHRSWLGKKWIKCYLCSFSMIE